MADTIDVDRLDRADKAALERLIITLADTKRMLGIRYSDWLIGSPSIETGIAASSMCQDEWGHARLLYAMLKQLGKDPGPYERERPAAQYASTTALDEEAPDWAALVAMMVLVDGAATAMLESFAAGAFEQANSRVPKMLAEEEFHASLGAAWYRRLADSDGEAKALLTEATRRMLPSLLTWVGTDDEVNERLLALGVIEPAAARLTRFRDGVRELVAVVGVDVDAEDGRGEWDSTRARTAGQPTEEAVERARGDRNRALFVE